MQYLICNIVGLSQKTCRFSNMPVEYLLLLTILCEVEVKVGSWKWEVGSGKGGGGSGRKGLPKFDLNICVEAGWCGAFVGAFQILKFSLWIENFAR